VFAMFRKKAMMLLGEDEGAALVETMGGDKAKI